MMKTANIYLKTTETCNLNCKHCFTNGKNGKKIYWNVELVMDWIKRLNHYFPNLEHVHFEFHGGEPFLVPLHQMEKVYSECNGLWKNMSWGATTNLVYKIDNDYLNFVKKIFNNRIATSWDPNIRFSNEKQKKLWEKNVKILIKENIDLKLFVSVTKDVIKTEPIELLKYFKNMKFKEVSFERLTKNGNANLFPEIFPSNEELNKWFLLMHEQNLQYNCRNWFDNEFLENIYSKFEDNLLNLGTFCRDCEQKLFTINADGTIAGCPNSAPEDYYGHITQEIEEMINSPKRMEIISCEASRDPRCYECSVFSYCGGDCHQLEWNGDICAAPKDLMIKLSNINSKKKFIIFKEEKCL
jgi:radical SAM protein with 4Fe4S-binding SPASM domain